MAGTDMRTARRAWSFAGAVLFTALPAGASANLLFDAPPVVQAGDGLRSVASGDFNDDGAPDLVAANASSGDVTVCFGEGDGSFEFPVSIRAGSGAWAVAAADLNGDGLQDIAVACADADSIVVLLGAGDGTFLGPARFATGDKPQCLVVGDMNADGVPDIATADYQGDTVSVLLGHGDGGFAPKVSKAAGDSPRSLVMGDFDGDGHGDIAVSLSTVDHLAVLLGNGDGTLKSCAYYVVGDEPRGMAAADVDGDGALDLLTTERGGESVSVWHGNGDGTFGNYQSWVEQVAPMSVTAADMNGDGLQDLVIAGDPATGYPQIVVRRGDGTGAFSNPLYFPSVSGPTVPTIADFDGDGLLDVGVGSERGNSIAVFAGLGGGQLHGITLYPLGARSADIVVGDFNADGAVDIATVNNYGNVQRDVSILINAGDGTFLPGRHYSGLTDPEDICAVDVDSDGDVDLAINDRPAHRAAVMISNGEGTFGSMSSFPTGEWPRAVCGGDVNGDGRADLVVSIYSQDALYLHLGNGDGTFQTARTLPVGDGCGAAVITDVNADSKADIAVTNFHASSVSLLLGHGDGTFDAHVDLPLSGLEMPFYILAADLSGDGLPDLVVANNAVARVLVGHGDGTFEEGALVSAGPVVTGVTVGDFNEDSILDVVTSNVVAGTVAAFLGQGDGTFEPRRDYAVHYTSGTAQRVVAGDFNGDGTDDLAVGDALFSSVAVLLSTGSETAVDGVLYGAATGAESVTLGWSLGSLSGVRWLHVYRSLSATGPFTRVNPEPLEPSALGSYEDVTVWPGETFWYELRSEGWDGSEESTTAGRVQVRTPGELVTRLSSAMPNPSAGGMQFEMDVASDVSDARLVVYGVSGREVRVLVDGRVERGRHEVEWDGRDGSGHEVAAGVYFARLVTPERTAVCKIAVVK